MTKQARAMKKSFGKKDANKKKEQRREQEMLKRITEEANRKAAAAVAATGYRLPIFLQRALVVAC
jgi:acyl CoA:acetate/3-ketoacid CoA transferase alpha subunit